MKNHDFGGGHVKNHEELMNFHDFSLPNQNFFCRARKRRKAKIMKNKNGA